MAALPARDQVGVRARDRDQDQAWDQVQVRGRAGEAAVTDTREPVEN